ncbi:MAG: hypothetical protein AAF581_02845 [Planctomycetota bacterium]
MRSRAYCATLLVMFVSSGALLAQDSRPTSQPTSRPGMTRIRLLDGTTWFQTPERERTPTYLGGAEVRVTATGATAVDATADGSGTVELDLQSVPAGSVVQLMARRGEDVFVAYPWRSDQRPAETMPFYRVTRSPADLELAVLRIVTERTGASGELEVHVEQVVTFADRNFQVYLPELMEQGTPSSYFPIPTGAEVLSIAIDGESVSLGDIRDVPGFGRGVAFNNPVFPQARWSGSYTLRWDKGAPFDLGLGTTFFPGRLHLALQEDRFAYAPESGTFEFQDLGVERPEGSDVRCRFWQNDTLAVGTDVAARVVYADREPAAAGLDKLRFVLTTRLFDGTRWFKEGEAGAPEGGHGDIVARTQMASLELEVRLLGLDGEPETVMVQTNERGELQVDLGERYQESKFTLATLRNGEPYESPPISVGAVPNMVLMYRVGRDPARLGQTLMRIVSEVVNEDTGTAEVKVRQMIQVTNRAYEIYPESDGNYFFPIPEGAIVDELSVDGVGVPIVAPKTDAEWGYGIPMSIAVEAQGRGRQVMGTFRLQLEEGAKVDLGVGRPGPIEEFTLALEQPRFQFSSEGSTVVLQDGGQQKIMNRDCKIYSGKQAAGTSGVAMVHYGRPPVKSKTWILTLVILTVIVGGVGFGIMLSSARARRAASGGSPVSQLAELDGRLARSEITPEQYQEEQQRLEQLIQAGPQATAPPVPIPATLKAQLTALSSVRDRDAEQIAQDYEALAAAVREVLSRDGES